MKKTFSIIICFLMLLSVFPLAVFAVSESGEEGLEDPFADITTPHLLLMEAETGAVLYERSAYDMAFPASTTKLMTAILAVENIENLDKVITVGWRAISGFGPKSSMMGLAAYEEIAIIDVLHGLMMRSGNDAAKCIAIETVKEAYGDSVPEEDAIDKFLEMMNEKAKYIGMESTNFATVDGRHDPNHYSSAYDFGLLMQYVLKNPIVCEIMSTKVYDVEPTNMHPDGYHFENSNKLICKKKTDKYSYLYEYCIGGKTGETNEAGYCLASAAEKDGVTLILIQFGDDNTEISTTYRYRTAPKIYDWGFENFVTRPLSEFGLETDFEIQTSGYSPFDENIGKLEVTADIDNKTVSGAAYFLDALAESNEEILFELHTDKAEAPIEAGDIVGTVDYYFYTREPVTVSLIAKRSIAAAAQEDTDTFEPVYSSNTPPPGSDKNTNLNLNRNPGGKEYSVWVYYDGSLYTMGSTEWHYLYCAEGVFRAASAPENAGGIQLYKQCFDSNGVPYYLLVENAGQGGNYIIVSDGFAMSSEKTDGTLSAVKVTIDSNNTITTAVTEDMIWTFENEGNGYHISQNSRFLSRGLNSGIIFWIIIFTAFLLIICIIKISISRKRRRYRRYPSGRRQKSRYRKYRRR